MTWLMGRNPDKPSHPTRVRGLKSSVSAVFPSGLVVAPYAGAWIEIVLAASIGAENTRVAPYAGAWIEIVLAASIGAENTRVAPYAGAWIEIVHEQSSAPRVLSHPTRVRGLKSLKSSPNIPFSVSHPTRVRGLKLSIA